MPIMGTKAKEWEHHTSEIAVQWFHPPFSSILPFLTNEFTIASSSVILRSFAALESLSNAV